MKNEKTLDKIFLNLVDLIEDYGELEETKEAEDSFWAYVVKRAKEKKAIDEKELEDLLYEVSFYRERQGFLYGFNYALQILGLSKDEPEES